MAKITKEQIQVVKTAFDNYNRLIKLEQDDYLECLLTTMKKHDFKTFNRGESDFRDFAIKGYLHNLKKVHDESLAMLLAIEETRAIIDDFDPHELA